jgi:hypothetical protein
MADNTLQRLPSNGNKKGLVTRYHKCLGCGGDYMEIWWDVSTIVDYCFYSGR